MFQKSFVGRVGGGKNQLSTQMETMCFLGLWYFVDHPTQKKLIKILPLSKSYLTSKSE